MTDKEKIVDKIRKLLALSKSANEHEAVLAMENANKLLMKHNLDMMDITETNISGIFEEEFYKTGRIIVWKDRLLNIVTQLNNCQVLVYRNRKQNTIHVVGKKHNIEVSIAIYDYLINVMDRAIKVHKKEYDLDVNSFRLGFVRAIGIKVKDIIKSREQKNNSFDESCNALMIIEKNLIKNYLNNKYKDLKEEKTKKTYYKNPESYNKGFQKGTETSLNNQLY